MEVLFVQEFEDKHKLFEDFVNTFYNISIKKNCEKGTSEYIKYDVLQNMCKLIMNNSYGTLVMRSFDDMYKFMNKNRFVLDYGVNNNL